MLLFNRQMNRLLKIRIAKITAGIISTVAGLMVGTLAWSHLAPDVLPDLSEKPAIISFYRPSR